MEGKMKRGRKGKDRKGEDGRALAIGAGNGVGKGNLNRGNTDGPENTKIIGKKPQKESD